MSDSLWLHGLYSPWNSPGQNTGVGNLSLLQGIFPTQELNRGLLHCRWTLHHLSYQGSPSTPLTHYLCVNLKVHNMVYEFKFHWGSYWGQSLGDSSRNCSKEEGKDPVYIYICVCVCIYIYIHMNCLAKKCMKSSKHLGKILMLITKNISQPFLCMEDVRIWGPRDSSWDRHLII